MSALFSSPKMPAPVIPQPAPTNDSAGVVAAAEDQRRRAAAAQGRSSTILPGNNNTLAPSGQKTLLGS
jgi:hypothetical protein